MSPRLSGMARTQPALDPSRLIFIDETWAKTNMTRRYGRARRGRRVCANPLWPLANDDLHRRFATRWDHRSLRHRWTDRWHEFP